MLRDPRAEALAAAGGFLTVREAARVLKVSTATVYKLCARGELAHVRVSNVIRIPSGTVGDLKQPNS